VASFAHLGTVYSILNKRLVNVNKGFWGTLLCTDRLVVNHQQKMKTQSLRANIALIAMLTLLPLSSGSIQMLEKLAISITLVDFATKLLDKENQP
jgi:hypothetical protein